MFRDELTRLRWTALAEGVSYLVLLLVAMPLKYIWGMPLAVRIFGMAHGVLCMLLIVVLMQAHLKYRWKAPFSLMVFCSSLIPLGAFWMDGRLKDLEAKAVQL